MHRWPGRPGRGSKRELLRYSTTTHRSFLPIALWCPELNHTQKVFYFSNTKFLLFLSCSVIPPWASKRHLAQSSFVTSTLTRELRIRSLRNFGRCYRVAMRATFFWIFLGLFQDSEIRGRFSMYKSFVYHLVDRSLSSCWSTQANRRGPDICIRVLNRVFSKGRKSILTNSGFPQKWTGRNVNENPRCLLAAGWLSLTSQLNEELDAFRTLIQCFRFFSKQRRMDFCPFENTRFNLIEVVRDIPHARYSIRCTLFRESTSGRSSLQG